MRKLVLDTNVLIAFLRAPEAFAARFSAYDLVLLFTAVPLLQIA